tara:strand:+ start:456 stop:776 length:321 start_codon:yes stop_codon:yes gene_type:complete
MNTKSFNYFRNAFALIGFFIIACSVASDDENIVDNNDNDITIPIQSNNGKYQLSVTTGAALYGSSSISTTYLTVLNTATGSMKTYSRNKSNDTWQEISGMSMTFTH